MKNFRNLLFGILSIGLLFIGTTVEAKTVNWNDLVAKLKDGLVVEALENVKTNGENVEYSITSDDTKFVFTSTIEGVAYNIQMDYSNGVVVFTDNTIIDTEEKEMTILYSTMWCEDIIRAAGDLYGYKESEVINFIQNGNGKTNLTLAEDGIEMTISEYRLESNGQTISGEKIASFKLDLVNGFADLVEDTSDCADPEPTPESTPSTNPGTNSENTPIVNPDTPEEAPEKNPATGDVQVYQIIGGIVVCLIVAGIAIKNLRNKEEII